MDRLTVWLDGWEHECCGPPRRVGDDINLHVYAHDKHLYEQRHDYQNSQESRPIWGQLVGIQWHRAILEPLEFGQQVVGCGPGVTLNSTDDRPQGDSSAFELTVESREGLEPKLPTPVADVRVGRCDEHPT